MDSGFIVSAVGAGLLVGGLIGAVSSDETQRKTGVFLAAMGVLALLFLL